MDWQDLPQASDAQIDFLLADLDVGMTFAQMAGDRVHSDEARRRHLGQAREAHRAVTYHFGQVRMRPREATRIEQGLAALQRAIDAAAA